MGFKLNNYVKRSLMVVLSFCLICTTLCSSAYKDESGFIEKEEITLHSNIKHRIIIDTDTAADDAAAMLLAAESKNITIEGITVSAGNVSLEQAANNALMTMEIAGKDIPVYKGATTNYAGVRRETFSVFGNDGMGDCGLIKPTHTAMKQSAVDFILEKVNSNPNEIEIMCLGPVTNIAIAIKKDPNIMKKVKRIWSMGTAGVGVGNATPIAEFNVYKDAEAYKILVDSGIDITVVGLDQDVKPTWLTEDYLAKMKKGTKAQSYIANACRKMVNFRIEAHGEANANIPDVTAMAALVWSDYIMESHLCHASCIADDGETYGQVIFYRSDIIYDSMVKHEKNNVTLVSQTRTDCFMKRLNQILSQ